DQGAGPLGEPRQHGDGRLGRRFVALDEAVDDVDAPVAGPVGQRAAQSRRLHLLRRPLLVAVRGGTVHDAAAGVLRSPDRALSGPAGALLAVRLAAAAGHLAAA